MSDKYTKLLNRLKDFKRVIVAFSGGVDSTLALKAAIDALGTDNVLAGVASSQLDERDISQEILDIAKELGSQVRLIKINELDHDNIRNYSPDSWYHSKILLYNELNRIKEAENYCQVIDGMIMDDLKDFRPGLLARDHCGILSVLQDAGIYKTDVRNILKELGVSVWSKPSSCSLLSRFSYGDEITEEKLHQIRQGEQFLSEQSYPINRVRVHDNLARIEIAEDYFDQMIKNRESIERYFCQIGFTFTTIDLRPYQSGRMNENLSKEVLDKFKQEEVDND